jgi:transposase
VQHALAALLEQPRTWTASQLSRALEVHGLHLGPRQVRRYLHDMGASWQRTKMSLTHKQRLEEVARAGRRLATLKKGSCVDGLTRPYRVSFRGLSPAFRIL